MAKRDPVQRRPWATPERVARSVRAAHAFGERFPLPGQAAAPAPRPALTCYLAAGKPKSSRLCLALAAGAGGRSIAAVLASSLLPGPAGFYGVHEDTLALWREAVASGRDWYFIDNAYFDSVRGVRFRLTKNALQASGREGRPDWARFARLKLAIRPWRKGGRHVLVCPQSDWYLRTVCGWPGGADGWQRDVLLRLRAATDRPIVVRPWLRDKGLAAGTLQRDLETAHALVTHSSAAANEALAAGIPVFVTGACAAQALASGPLEAIERPAYPEGREPWAARLAGQQWGIDELENGTAWRALHAADAEHRG